VAQSGANVPVKRMEKFQRRPAMANSGALYPSIRLLARAKLTVGAIAAPLTGAVAGTGRVAYILGKTCTARPGLPG